MMGLLNIFQRGQKWIKIELVMEASQYCLACPEHNITKFMERLGKKECRSLMEEFLMYHILSIDYYRLIMNLINPEVKHPVIYTELKKLKFHIVLQTSHPQIIIFCLG